MACGEWSPKGHFVFDSSILMRGLYYPLIFTSDDARLTRHKTMFHLESPFGWPAGHYFYRTADGSTDLRLYRGNSPAERGGVDAPHRCAFVADSILIGYMVRRRPEGAAAVRRSSTMEGWAPYLTNNKGPMRTRGGSYVLAD